MNTSIKVSNMVSSRGNTIANQFVIKTDEGEYFQSYSSVIVYIPSWGAMKSGARVSLDEKYYNYSKTTSKYRNIFMGETTKEIETKIKAGEYILTNLN